MEKKNIDDKRKKEKWYLLYNLLCLLFVSGCSGFGLFWVYYLSGYNFWFSMFFGMMYSALVILLIRIGDVKE